MSKVTTQSKPFAVDAGKPTTKQELCRRADELHSSLKKECDERPEGSFTSHEFAEEIGVSESTARRRLRMLMLQGKLKAFGQKASPLRYYMLVEDTME